MINESKVFSFVQMSLQLFDDCELTYDEVKDVVDILKDHMREIREQKEYATFADFSNGIKSCDTGNDRFIYKGVKEPKLFRWVNYIKFKLYSYRTNNIFKKAVKEIICDLSYQPDC